MLGVAPETPDGHSLVEQELRVIRRGRSWVGTPVERTLHNLSCLATWSAATRLGHS